MGGLHMSCSARAYLENLQTGYSRDGVSKCLPQDVIEEKLDSIIGAILSTKPSKILTSSVAEARALGHPLWMSSFFLLSPYCHLATVPR